MNLTNRRIKCEVSKTIQEQQYEPFQVTMMLEGDVTDNTNLDIEFGDVETFLEEKVFAAIYNKMGD